MPPIIQFITVKQTLPLRSRVLREGRPFDQCTFAEDGQPGSFHIGSFRNDDVTGIASYYPKDLDGQRGRGFQLRGMAIAPDLQRAGAGRAILNFGEAHIRSEQLADYLWCNARVSAIPFYERDGWSVVSEAFLIPEVGPHCRMVKRLDVDPLRK